MVGGPDPGGPLDVAIRPAAVTDAGAMGSVWHRAALAASEGASAPAEPPLPTAGEVADDWRRLIEVGPVGALVLVACDAGPDGPVVGTIAVVPDPHDSSRGEVTGLYVDPDHWRRGVGRALHDAALDHLRWAGFRMAMLWVVEGSLRVRATFERWGWQLTGGRRTELPGGDELCYLRSL